MRWLTLLFLGVFLAGFTESVFAVISYEVTVTNPPSIYTGTSTTVTFQIKNKNTFWSGHCNYNIDSGQWSGWFDVPKGQIVPKTVSVSAPPWGSGTGSVQPTITTVCYDDSDSSQSAWQYKNTQFTLFYTENPTYVAKTNAQTKIASAQNAITSAQSSISSAQNAINSAKSIGADTSVAEVKLSFAQSSLQNAQNQKSSADSLFNSESYEAAATAADNAKTYADSAKTDADSAYDLAIKSKIDAEKAKNQAQTAVNSANDAITAASSAINSAKTAINDAKAVGATVTNAEVKLTSAQSSLQNAQSKYTTATSNLNSNNFNSAKSAAEEAVTYANSAKSNADEALTLANQAKQIVLSLKKDAETAVDNAKKSIEATKALIDTVQKLILESKNSGLDVTSAQPTLDAASSKLKIAASKYNDAVSQLDALKYEVAKEYVKEAETYAIEASTNAKNAESTTTQLKEKLATELGQAELKLASAQATYNSVVDLADQTNKIITLISEMKIDTSGFSKELEKVTSTLIDAKAEVDKAKARFNNKEYVESKKSSSTSLEITEKHITILQNIQYNAALATKEVVTKRHSTITSLYSSALKTLEDTKAKMTGDVYSSRKEKLEKAKASLDKYSNLISNGDSYANAKNYYDAINSYRSAYSELDSAESLSTGIKSSITTEQTGIIQKIIDFINGLLKSIFG